RLDDHDAGFPAPDIEPAQHRELAALDVDTDEIGPGCMRFRQYRVERANRHPDFAPRESATLQPLPMLGRQRRRRILLSARDLEERDLGAAGRISGRAFERLRARARGAAALSPVGVGLDQDSRPAGLLKVIRVAQVDAVIRADLDEEAAPLAAEMLVQPAVLAVLRTVRAPWMRRRRRAHRSDERRSSYALRMPACRSIRALQPSAFMRETSSSLRGVPSGRVASNWISPSRPTVCKKISASSRIVMSVPVPTLKRPSPTLCSITNTHASARSSACRNSRRGLPDPHPPRRRSPPTFAWCALRSSAASTWLLSIS